MNKIYKVSIKNFKYIKFNHEIKISKYFDDMLTQNTCIGIRDNDEPENLDVFEKKYFYKEFEFIFDNGKSYKLNIFKYDLNKIGQSIFTLAETESELLQLYNKNKME